MPLNSASKVPAAAEGEKGQFQDCRSKRAIRGNCRCTMGANYIGVHSTTSALAAGESTITELVQRLLQEVEHLLSLQARRVSIDSSQRGAVLFHKLGAWFSVGMRWLVASSPIQPTQWSITSCGIFTLPPALDTISPRSRASACARSVFGWISHTIG